MIENPFSRLKDHAGHQRRCRVVQRSPQVLLRMLHVACPQDLAGGGQEALDQGDRRRPIDGRAQVRIAAGCERRSPSRIVACEVTARSWGWCARGLQRLLERESAGCGGQANSAERSVAMIKA